MKNTQLEKKNQTLVSDPQIFHTLDPDLDLEIFHTLDPDLDLQIFHTLDPDPHEMDVDPKPCQGGGERQQRP